MMKGTIISSDVRLLDRWNGGLQGEVHSVYSGAIYLRDNHGRLACLTTAEQHDGPWIARIDRTSFADAAELGLRQGTAFFVNDSSALHCGRLELAFSHSRKWDRPLPVFPPMTVSTAILSTAKELLLSDGNDGGYKYFFQHKEPADLFVTALRQRGQLLLTALRHSRFAEAKTHGLSLIGLGHGLTPSGDDFLAALITVFHLPGGPFPEECRQIGQCWATAADSTTTTVGALLLHTAAEGRAREPVSEFIAALATNQTEAILQAARQVLAFGSCSGTDWLAGLIAGVEAGWELIHR
jgi:hypothetical protein